MEEYTNIRIGFSRSSWTSIPGWVIRIIERTPYNHVYVELKVGTYKTDVIYQASGSQVNLVNKKIFKKNHKITHSFDFVISIAKKRELIGWVLENVGTKYGFLQVIGIGYVKLMYLFGMRTRNPFGVGRTSQVCSELVGIVLKEYLGEDIQEDLDVVGPKGIFNFIKEIKKL